MIFEPAHLSVTQLRERFLLKNRKFSRKTLELLAVDPRDGVRRLAEVLVRRAQAEREERRRVSRMLRNERELWRSGTTLIGGVDEAGIGPLAGPVVAACVVFQPGTGIIGVDDSKKLTPEDRKAIAGRIQREAVSIGIGVADVTEIDRINIYHAGLLAMRRAVEGVTVQPEHVFVDARTIPGIAFSQTGIIHGDAICYSVAAASIIAKVHRDRLMEELDCRFPVYGFCRHKGYSTPAHKKAIRQHGPCQLHRESFLYIKEVHGDCSPLFYSLLAQLDFCSDLQALGLLEESWEALKLELNAYEQRKFRERMLRRRKRLESEGNRC